MGDQTPSLSNADFRKLLATPRRDQPTPKAGATPKRDPNKPKRPYTKPKPQGQTEEEDDASKYRDRAEERRRGINPDYNTANQMLNAFAANDVDPTKLSIEDSKYLGGDLDHTHLVKGLDYALLQKTRSEMEKPAEGEEEGGAGAAAAAGEAVKREEVLVINHPLAKSVHTVLFVPRRSNIFEQFLPRRCAFVYTFEADEDGVVQDIPTTLRRSKADCPAPPDAVFARMDNTVLERISKIMSYIKTGKDGKKMKKKDREEMVAELAKLGSKPATPQGSKPATPAASNAGSDRRAPTASTASTAADEEEDIFGDAGTDYKPSVTGKKKNFPAPAAAGGDDMDLEEGEMGPPPPPPLPPPPQDPYAHMGDPYLVQQQHQLDAGMAGYDQAGGYGQGAWVGGGGYDGYGAGAGHERGAGGGGGADVPKWRVRAGKAAEKEVDFVDDAYGEYYPMAGGFEVPALDDDEEEGKEGGKGEKPRPEAGKGPGKGTEKEAARAGHAKINSQLQKIEGIFKDKGQDHSGAFGRTPGRMPAGSKTPGGRWTGDDPSLNLKDKKRQRI